MTRLLVASVVCGALLGAACAGSETAGSGAEPGGIPEDSDSSGGVGLDALPGASGDPSSARPNSSGPDAPDGSDPDPDASPGLGPTVAPSPTDTVDTAASDGSGDPVPVDPSSPAGGQQFTRLTRLEYVRTVEAALGITPDVAAIPVDGRVGVFTSNATVTPDPVHPYLLLAEGIAERVVPERLPACESDVGACLSDEYREPLTALYRREPSTAELANLEQRFQDLADAGATPVVATRAMLAAALVGPDFLFRTSPSNATGATGRRLAERLSFALWDAPPDAGLLDLAALTGADLTAAATVQAGRVARDERAIEGVARFVGQWLDVDTDRLQEDDSEFAESASYQELLALIADALASDVPIRELVRSERAFVHEDNAEAYELGEISGDSVTIEGWPEGSARRGLLGQELFASSTRHPDPSRRVIFRGLLVRRSLLCQEIPAPSADLVALAGEVGDRTEDSRCATCHQLLDPIGRAFAPLDPDSDDPPEPAVVVGGEEIMGTYADLPTLLDAIAESREFAECFAEHFLSFFLEQEPGTLDAALVASLGNAVEEGASFGTLVELTAGALATESENTIPWCEGE